jgi:hypothetical protein
MNRINHLQPQFVEFIPDRLDQAVLYVSRRFSTATHLCCCGCGREVVTPLNPAKWCLIEQGDTVSLSPSIGNWSFPCRSHYWITANRVLSAGAISPEMIAAVKARDRLDAERLGKRGPDRIRVITRSALAVWRSVKAWITGRWWSN